MKAEISASMMCADFLAIGKDLTELKNAGIEYLHFDIMDGAFVPNYTLGPCMLDALRGQTDITYDIHLMVERPEEKLRFFDIRPGDVVSFHYESTCHVQRMLAAIRSLGAKAGIALNPATPVQILDYILDDIDFVLVMTVNPGYAGQKMISATLDKIAHVRRMLDESGHRDIPIQVDGNVDYDNARKMRRAGADIFVAGSSGLFMKDVSIQNAAAKLRDAIA